MANSQLIQYIRENRERKVSDAEIRKALASEAWTNDEIEDAFASLDEKKLDGEVKNGVIEIGELINSTWSDTKMKLKAWLIAYLIIIGVGIGVWLLFIMLLGGGIAGLLVSPYLGGLVFVLAILVMVLYAIWVQYGLIRLVISDAPPKPTAILFQFKMSRLWGLFGLGILAALIIMGGYLLLIIPGLILLVYLMFASIVYVKEQVGMFEALQRSVYYVSGGFWAVVLRLLVLVGLGIVCNILVSVLNFVPLLGMLLAIAFGFIWSLYAQVYLYQLYKSLVEQKSSSDFVAVGWFKPTSIILAGLAILLWIGLFVGIGVLISRISPEVRDSLMKGNWQEYLMNQGLDQLEQEMTDEEKMAIEESLKSLENLDIQDMDDLTNALQGDMQNGIAYAILQAMLLDYYNTNGEFPINLSALDAQATEEQFVLPPEMDVRYEQRAGGEDFELCTTLMGKEECVTGADLLEK